MTQSLNFSMLDEKTLRSLEPTSTKQWG